jgi:hypothetical protein
MQHSVYPVLGVNISSWPGETERSNRTQDLYVIVELRTRKGGIREDGGNYH